MDIRQDIHTLSELGLLDQKIISLDLRIKSLPEKANELTEKAKKLRKKLTPLTDEKTAKAQQKRILESSIQLDKATIKQWENRANNLTGEREISALTSEIRGQKKRIYDNESEVLAIMEVIEDLDVKINSLEAKIKSTEALSQSETDFVKGELDEKTATLNELIAAKEKLLVQLSPSIKSRYTRVAERREGVGIALLTRAVCSCCQRTLPYEMFNRVIRSEMIEYCPSCSRILVANALEGADATEKQS